MALTLFGKKVYFACNGLADATSFPEPLNHLKHFTLFNKRGKGLKNKPFPPFFCALMDENGVSDSGEGP